MAAPEWRLNDVIHQFFSRSYGVVSLGLLAASATVWAQEPPLPPIPPAPAVAPLPPINIDLPDLSALHAQIEAKREQIEDLRFNLSAKSADIAVAVQKSLTDFGLKGPAMFAPQKMFYADQKDGDRQYERGQRALDSRRWEEALTAFSQVESSGPRADGALYWKAYALHQLGRRDEALAAIGQLQKAHASSRWLTDAAALQAAITRGGTADTENTEELKAIALNALLESEPERALPLIETMLKGSASPRLKDRALHSLARCDSQRCRELLGQIARGATGNPDLQVRAIRVLGSMGKRTDNRQLLWDIYSSATDDGAKRAVLRGFASMQDREHLVQAAKTDRSVEIRREAIRFLGNDVGQAELWSLYQAEASADVREDILRSMRSSGDAAKLAEVARNEKDPKLRQAAIRALGSIQSAPAEEALLAIHAADSDPAIRRAILGALSSRNSAKALVALAKSEKDPEIRREIVGRLSRMKSAEATDYLMELLK